jgi:hypothetical protein
LKRPSAGILQKKVIHSQRQKNRSMELKKKLSLKRNMPILIFGQEAYKENYSSSITIHVGF